MMTGRSWLVTDCTASWPSPGRPNTLSVTITPPSSVPMSMPACVTIGVSAAPMSRPDCHSIGRRGLPTMPAVHDLRPAPVDALRISFG
jgi:hypothetical protein